MKIRVAFDSSDSGVTPQLSILSTAGVRYLTPGSTAAMRFAEIRRII